MVISIFQRWVCIPSVLVIDCTISKQKRDHFVFYKDKGKNLPHYITLLIKIKEASELITTVTLLDKPRKNTPSRLSMIVQVNVVLNSTVAVHSD